MAVCYTMQFMWLDFQQTIPRWPSELEKRSAKTVWAKSKRTHPIRTFGYTRKAKTRRHVSEKRSLPKFKWVGWSLTIVVRDYLGKIHGNRRREAHQIQRTGMHRDWKYESQVFIWNVEFLLKCPNPQSSITSTRVLQRSPNQQEASGRSAARLFSVWPARSHF